MNNYRETIDKMRWSYSRVSTFAHCKYEFYLNYIINNNDCYLSEGNFYAEVGSFVHEILAMIFSNKLSLPEATEYFINNYENNVFYTTKDSTMEKTYNACIEYLSTVDFDWLTDYEILGVESEIAFKLEKYSFVATPDLILRNKTDGGIVIVDHKSTPFPLKKNGKDIKKSSQESFDTYKKQMYLYSHAIKQIYNEFPSEIWWNHFKDGGRFVKIQFSLKEYNEIVGWFVDTIKRIEIENDFESTLEYFYCKNLCNFRNSCEYCAFADWK